MAKNENQEIQRTGLAAGFNFGSTMTAPMPEQPKSAEEKPVEPTVSAEPIDTPVDTVEPKKETREPKKKETPAKKETQEPKKKETSAKKETQEPKKKEKPAKKKAQDTDADADEIEAAAETVGVGYRKQLAAKRSRETLSHRTTISLAPSLKHKVDEAVEKGEVKSLNDLVNYLLTQYFS